MMGAEFCIGSCFQSVLCIAIRKSSLQCVVLPKIVAMIDRKAGIVCPGTSECRITVRGRKFFGRHRNVENNIPERYCDDAVQIEDNDSLEMFLRGRL